ncbi:hypothetical protein E6R18_23525 [Streptomyces sp. A1277]|uniref:hypothetical protein n=1 Tax=Streptomyces sp. A1277 TaxID=2563103 RepID=UPI0010A2A2DA|nr:hypothetical protein [Streptomyces sp. A1277]THA29573.1 hypothetical protein E6R18_23525 [Streptomyces sp. A1277]
MTEQERVTVNDPRGPVNNGEGHQYVFYGAGPDWLRRKGVESLRIVREDRVRLADRFAPPGGYRAAAERLEKPGSVVLLDAPPGSGRRAAAIMLLHELGEDGGTDEVEARFEELPATDTDEDAPVPGESDRFLLDLSGITDEDAYAKARHRLAVSRSRVQRAGAHMVVVLPSGMGHAHAPDLEPDTVKLRRPRGVAVITRHLRVARMDFRPSDLRSAGLQHLCDRSPMRELARLAGLVRDARDSGRFGADFAGWLDQAMHAVTDRADEVGRQVGDVRTAPERALLLAAAVFEGARADTVYEAWHGLMRAVRHEEETTTELARTDFGERLADLEIERDAEGRLHFRPLAYAEAVRTYFWANFPGLRDDLRDWIAQATGFGGLTIDDRLNVVIRFGEQSLTVGRPDHLFDLVVRWADGVTGAACDPRAVAALELGLSHERLGGWFRRRMYECARSGSLSDGLVRVLTAACRQNLAATYPDQALVRLHYLAARQGEAAREAREALLDLGSSDPELYRLLIGRLRNRTCGERRGATAHLQLLTELLGSDWAPDPPPWPELFRGWETVFSGPPTDRWAPLVTSWLTSVAQDGTRDMALGVMVGATHGRATALHRLYAIACDWAAARRDPPRAAVADRFWRHIDQAPVARTERSEPTRRTGGAEPPTTEEER